MGNTQNNEELSLLNKYLCGDTASGEVLFGSVYPIVSKFVYAQTRHDIYLNESDKEDIIVDAMIRVLDKSYLYKGNSKFSTFVCGFARNIILEKRKGSAKQAQNIEMVANSISLESIDVFQNPLNVLIKKEEIEIVNKALSLLEEDHRMVLFLRLINGMSFKQIGELSGKSDDAVDSMFRRALKAFKKKYEEISN